MSLVFARQAMSINEGAAAVLYLFCGAVFPPDLLPAPLRGIGFALPLTYWLEACRRALTHASTSGLLSRLSDAQVALAQLATTALWLAGGLWLFRVLLRRALRDGKVDQTTAW
jgi:ABC-2 type transport system permease protein